MEEILLLFDSLDQPIINLKHENIHGPEDFIRKVFDWLVKSINNLDPALIQGKQKLLSSTTPLQIEPMPNEAVISKGTRGT